MLTATTKNGAEMTAAQTTDHQLAVVLAACKDHEAMLGAENDILERLDVPLDESELGLTKNAVSQIETFVSRNLGREWTYADLPASIVEGA